MAKEDTSKYRVCQANTRKHMDAIMEVIWAANYDPYEPFCQLIFPVLGFSPSDREKAIAESKERFWNNMQTGLVPGHWNYAIDDDTDEMVGCVQLEVRSQNPFPNESPKLIAPWWPEGECRDFCEHILNQVYKPRSIWMRRRHVALNWMAVHPSHRRRGVGTRLMDSCIGYADSASAELCLESSSMGKPLYEKHGLRSLLKIAFDTDKRDASDVWKKCEHEMKPEPVFFMWRPIGGFWSVGGVDVKMPWDLDVQKDIKASSSAKAVAEK